MSLRILADDLTGALDAAAPFASENRPVRLLLGESGTGADKLAFSTESRDMSEAQAMAAISAAFARLRPTAPPSTMWFKKVDSVLRGHPIAETLTLARLGGFQRCVFAPAFPEMGRITRHGFQMVRDGTTGWQVLPPGDLRRAMDKIAPAVAPGIEVVICDAESQSELIEAIRPWRSQPDVLWAGTRGLAEALAAEVVPVKRPPIGLFVLGTSHPITRGQARKLTGLVASARRTLPIQPSSSAPLLIDPVPECRTGDETRTKLGTILRRLQPPQDGSAIFVTGGACQAVLLAATEAKGAICIGEIMPGLPLCIILGGRLDGTLMVSKSGGFGGPDLLQALLAC